MIQHESRGYWLLAAGYIRKATVIVGSSSCGNSAKRVRSTCVNIAFCCSWLDRSVIALQVVDRDLAVLGEAESEGVSATENRAFAFVIRIEYY